VPRVLPAEDPGPRTSAALAKGRLRLSLSRRCERAPSGWLLLTLACALLAAGCRRGAPAHLSEHERRGLATQLKEAAEGAGGPRVWIKASAGFPPPRPETPIEALTTAEAYQSVIAALRGQAERIDLEFTPRQTRSGDGRRTTDIRVARGENQVCLWRIREVPRLLRAAIVIDDLGQDPRAPRQLLALPYPLTFSILPRLPYSLETAREAHRAGREVMLHLPMEPEPGPHTSPGEQPIRTGMTPEDMKRILVSDLASVPYAVGVNNHMGSRATTRLPLMASLMEDLAEHHLYFVDSRTTPDTVALETARRQGIPAFYRSVFLDDTETLAYTLEQLRELCRVVELQGVALAIGHPYPTTLTALAKFLPELERVDIQLVPPSQLVRLPEVVRLWPPRQPKS
jgi:polysaccharide deacetylase 2 family uncharacterized protein YibQ